MSNTPWTQERLDSTAADLIKQHGCIPSVSWLEVNGFGGMYSCIMKNGGIAKFREKYQGVGLNRKRSRDGQLWDSQAEVCAVDFIWSRGIEVHKGKPYPAEYSLLSGKHHGVYDFHFSLQNVEYDVEIWGADRMTGRDGTTRYADTKAAKLAFNNNRPNFIGIDYEVCYTDVGLEKAFSVFFPVPPVVRYAREADRQFSPAVWNLADDVLEKCQYVSSHMPSKRLPPQNWLTKANEHRGRPVEPWESGLGFSLTTLAANIRRVGGYPKVRQILGQPDNQWTKELVLEATVKCLEKYKTSPSAVASRLRKANTRSQDETVLMKEMSRLVGATKRFYGTVPAAHDEAKAILKNRT